MVWKRLVEWETVFGVMMVLVVLQRGRVVVVPWRWCR